MLAQVSHTHECRCQQQSRICDVEIEIEIGLIDAMRAQRPKRHAAIIRPLKNEGECSGIITDALSCCD